MIDRTLYRAVVGVVLEHRRFAVTQASIAKRAGLSQSALSRFEQGQTTPDAAELADLAQALETTTAELVRRFDEVYSTAISMRQTLGVAGVHAPRALATLALGGER